MKIIACVDNKMGFAFHGKRQSSDDTVNDFIRKLAEQFVVRAPLNCKTLFGEDCRVAYSNDLFSIARENDYCFIDTLTPRLYEERINGVILLRWNRDYPATQKLPSNPDEWRLVYTKDLVGKSHDKITMEVYERYDEYYRK